MKTSILTLSPFRSMSNVLPEMGRNPHFPKRILNWDIQLDGTLEPRATFSKHVSVTNPHSLYEGDFVLYRAGTGLYRLYPDGTTALIKDGFIGDLPLSYVEINKEVYFSDGVTSGIYDGAEVRSWGISIPNPPTLEAFSGGSLEEGTYRVKISYIDSRGNESGLSNYDEIYVSDNQKITITVSGITEPRADRINFYISDKNGGRFTLYGYEYVNGNTEVSIDFSVNYEGKSLPFTEGLTPPPKGHIVEYFSSRAVIAVDNAIFFTEPLSYELCDLSKNFVQLPDFVTNLVALNNLLVASTREEIYVINQNWAANKAYSGKIIGNSGVVIDASIIDAQYYGLGVVMASEEGLLLGLGDGRVVNITGKFYNFEGFNKSQSTFLKDGSYLLLNLQ